MSRGKPAPYLPRGTAMPCRVMDPLLGKTITALVLNPSVQVGSRFVLTVQDGGTVATGAIQVGSRAAGLGFVIKSSLGAADAGVIVYWQIWEGV